MNVKNERYLGIDYGDVRTGIAVSDPLGIMALGVGTVRATGRRVLLEEIKKYIAEYSASVLVLGLPVNMNGSEGERAEKVRDFARFLEEETGLEVVLFDERCTTMEAHQILNLTDTRGQKRKNAVDTLSAQIILQNYMDRIKNGK